MYWYKARLALIQQNNSAISQDIGARVNGLEEETLTATLDNLAREIQKQK